MLSNEPEYPATHERVMADPSTTSEPIHQVDPTNTSAVAEPREVLDPSEPLPPEILANIFGRLDLRAKGRAAQVCAAWRDVMYQQSLWCDVDARLHLRLQPRNPHLLASLTARGIRRVQVLSCDTCLCNLVADMPDIQSLDLSFCSHRLTNLTLVSAVGHRPLVHLTRLNLFDCRRVFDKSLAVLAKNCVNLTDLDLTSCSKITDTSLLHVGRHLAALTRLVVNHCAVSDVGIAYLTGSDTEEPTAGNAKLEHLGLNCCKLLTDRALRLMADGLPVLRFLDITWLTSITEVGFGHLARLVNLRELRASMVKARDPWLAHLAGTDIEILDLSQNSGLTREGLAHLSRMGCLQQLDLTGFDGEISINFLAESNVATLYLSSCSELNDSGLYQLARMTKLSKLDLGYCSGISNDGLWCLATGVTQLTSLDLTSDDQITDAGVHHLSRLPLRELDLSYCRKITKTGMGHLAKMGDLRKLNLTGCKVGDAGLAILTEGVANLAVLDLTECQQITDASLPCLTKMTNLREVDLSMCHGITSAGVSALVRRVPAIVSVEFLLK